MLAPFNVSKKRNRCCSMAYSTTILVSYLRLILLYLYIEKGHFKTKNREKYIKFLEIFTRIDHNWKDYLRF